MDNVKDIWTDGVILTVDEEKATAQLENGEIITSYGEYKQDIVGEPITVRYFGKDGEKGFGSFYGKRRSVKKTKLN